MRTPLLISTCLLWLSLGAQTDSVLYRRQASANTVLAARLQPVKGERQYITAEVIRIQGITRLSELLTWIDKAGYATIDWNMFYLNLNGTSTFQQQSLLLMINGQKVELERWDALNLDLLGIAITNIAYVEVFNTPTLVNGQFAGKGAINIVTRNDARGLTVTGYNNYGNPVGDPGPAQYMGRFASPNVHKTGFLYGTSAGYYAKKWHLNVSHTLNDWLLRSEQMTGRLALYDSILEKNTRRATRAEGALASGRYLLEAGAAIAEQDGYMYRNYLQTEIPVSITYREASVRLTKTLENNRYIRGNILVNANRYDHVPEVFPDYTYTTSNANLEYGKTWMPGEKPLKQVSGYTLEYASYTNGQTYQLQHKPYTSLSYARSRKVKQGLDMALAILGNTLNPSVAFRHEKYSSPLTSWSFVASYQQSRINQQHNQVWYFYQTGRSINPGAYPLSINSSPTHYFSADYFYYLTLSTSFRLTFNPGFRYQHNYHFIQPGPVMPDPVLVTGSSGATANFYTITTGINIHYDVFSGFWFDIDYFSANDQSADRQLGQLLGNDARRKLMLSFYYKLPARVDIGIRSQAVSSTTWQAYDETGNLTGYKLPATYTTDVHLNKKVWGDRIMLNTGIRNLFNQGQRLHPLGADFQMRFYITVMARLDDLLKYLPKK